MAHREAVSGVHPITLGTNGRLGWASDGEIHPSYDRRRDFGTKFNRHVLSNQTRRQLAGNALKSWTIWLLSGNRSNKLIDRDTIFANRAAAGYPCSPNSIC